MFKIRHKALILTKEVLTNIRKIKRLLGKQGSFCLTKSFFSVIFFTVCFTATAQKLPTQINLHWEQPDAPSEEGSRLTFLKFDGARYRLSESKLPFYSTQLPVSNPLQAPEATLEAQQFAPLTAEELKTDLTGVTDKVVVKTAISYERREARLYISFAPVRRNPQTGVYEKLLSANLVLSNENKAAAPVNRPAQRVYASSSVLASGEWFKIGVMAEGIYKVTYSFLRNMGMNSSATLQNIRLFGNGGGRVPQHNSLPRYDDLQENAIEVVDANANGSFDADDYFLFYGQSPDRWTYSSTDQRYHHQRNIYSDTTFYFITFSGGGNAKRIGDVASLPSSPTDRSVTTFVDYAFHEKDDKNFIKSGREWYGETFDVNLNQHFLFSFRNLVPGPVYIKSSVIGRTTVDATVYSYYHVVYNGTTLLNQSMSSVGTDPLDPHATEKNDAAVFNATDPDIDIEYQYIPYNSTSIGWLNYTELNATRYLALTSPDLFFRDRTTAVTNASYTVTTSLSGVSIWNITDPLNVTRQLYSFPEPGKMAFIAAPGGSGASEFAAFTSQSLKQPLAKGRVANQNLHALPEADYLIISYPDFMDEAERLADYHRTSNNLRVHVVSISDIYNEFSSGAKDISAIRDFAKMFYDRATVPADIPRYLLLFGDASYDYKNRISGNTDFIPTYQSFESLNPLSSYATDDFFGFLDDTEGDLGVNDIVDLGIGRLPIKNTSEARAMVDKVITYSTPGTSSDPAGYNTSSKSTRLGDWRTVLCFVADDEDGITHIDQSEDIVNILKGLHPEYNFDKINFDAYQQVSTPGGKRYPEVSDLITRRVEKGALLVNYTGHGGEVGWAHEQVLTVPMINSWKNINNMPAFVTATCEFSRYDDPGRTSAGELLMLNPDGGACCLFTTARVAFSNINKSLNEAFVRNLFEPINGSMPRVGDIYRKVKATVAVENFVLLGDPALMLAYPTYKVATTAILETASQQPEDTIQALSRITVKGIVTDAAGLKLTSFNGVVYPTIYDKEVLITTLQNDAGSGPYSFRQRKNIIYRGKASVTNGDFSCSFIVPRDIAYQYGKGRLSYYAHNGAEDAIGFDENFTIGGINAAGISDNTGPQIELYMNSDDFVFGGMTDEKPNIYAILTDSSGINTVGNGIGHDLVAKLDNNQEKLYILNDYYESDLDNYQQGRLVYPLEDLAPGRHSLELKAWDINNNSANATTEFIVAESAQLALAHVLNYPNPFTTHTTFMFEHNKPQVSMWVQVQVFTVTGKLIKTLDQYLVNEGFRNSSIEWDGKDDFGDPIGKGVYVYRLKIRTADGETADKYERLVVLK